MPIKRIAAHLGVAQSTVHLWTRDITLSPEQVERNLTAPGGPRSSEVIARSVATWKEKNRRRRLGYQQEGRERARVSCDRLHQAGCMLYWAEGSKSRNTVSLSNSDVELMRFFRRFLSTCFAVEKDSYRLSLHIYLGNGVMLEDIERYWLTALDLSTTCLRKHQINPLPTSSSGKKHNRLPYGVCKLTLNSTWVVQHIYGAIQEYGGFDEPRWLD